MNNYGFEYFDFHEDTFNLYPERVLEFCRKAKERKLNFRWACFCRVTNFSEEIAIAMKNAGCLGIPCGIIGGGALIFMSAKVRLYHPLKQLKKDERLRTVRNLLKLRRQLDRDIPKKTATDTLLIAT
jgi:hypothetical protein